LIVRPPTMIMNGSDPTTANPPNSN
jgi:hypothetical protein